MAAISHRTRIVQPSGDNSEGGQFNPAVDALGIGLQQRGLEHRAEYDASEREKDPYHLSGPLASPMWEGLQQALGEQGIHHLQGGPSAPGSTQLTGQSVQPGYLTTGMNVMGRPNADYRGTMFSSGQTNPGTGQNFQQEQRYKQALAGLRSA